MDKPTLSAWLPTTPVSHFYMPAAVDWGELKAKAERAAAGGVEVHLHRHEYGRPCGETCLEYKTMSTEELRRRYRETVPPPITKEEVERFKSDLRGDVL